MDAQRLASGSLASSSTCRATLVAAPVARSNAGPCRQRLPAPGPLIARARQHGIGHVGCGARRVACRPLASTAVPEPSTPGSPQAAGGSGALGKWALAVVVAGAAAAAAMLLGSPEQAAQFKAAVIDGPLGRSGFLAAFSLIFLSEIGDKTFFIAALLAMRLGRLVSFLGSTAALGVMTVISVAIGAACSRVPDALRSSVPLGELAGVVLLVVFGVRALREATKPDDGVSAQEDELAGAQEVVLEAESSGKVAVEGGTPSQLASIMQVASLIFLAEWGDRSMFATIALGAAQSPVGVAVGATVAHAAATAIAVVGGGLAGKYVSERSINLASGVLFLVFAAATVYGMLPA